MQTLARSAALPSWNAARSPADATSERVAALRLGVERMQAVRRGSAELDAVATGMFRDASSADCCDAAAVAAQITRGARWSTELDAPLALLPPDYNFSLGHRDGVYWAWIQPNDSWGPGEHEARHDHPGGSGLVVAHTAALAMTCAAILLRIRWLEAAAADEATGGRLRSRAGPRARDRRAAGRCPWHSCNPQTG